MNSCSYLSWIEVDLDSITENVQRISRLINEDTGREVLVMPVVKGGGYGCGIFEVVKSLNEDGIGWFAVSTLSEGKLARLAAPTANILCFGKIMDVYCAIQERLTCSIFNFQTAKEVSSAAKSLNIIAKVHIKINTGMNRLGFDCSDESINIIRDICALPNLDVEGIYSHFATSSLADKTYVAFQHFRFMAVINALLEKGCRFRIHHMANTGIILDNPELHMDLARFGSMVWGTFTSDDVHKDRLSLQEVFSLKSTIISINRVLAGEYVGYDYGYKCSKDSLVAILPIGYADIGIRGYCGNVIIHGKLYPVVGKVCMDFMMADITNSDNIKVGDTVTIVGEDNGTVASLHEVSSRLQTDGYGLMISSTSRLPRLYKKNGKVIAVMDMNDALAKHYAASLL